MRELGILFNAEMRPKVRDDLATMTRRVMVPQPERGYHAGLHCTVWYCHGRQNRPYQKDAFGVWLPYARYQVGDMVYMKEPYQLTTNITAHDICGYWCDDGRIFRRELSIEEFKKWMNRKKKFAKTSALFMYKSLARTWLKVTRAWVEQVQDISEENALSEGVRIGSSAMGHVFTAKEHFKALWNSINEKPKPIYIKGEIVSYISYPWDDTGAYAKMKTYRGKPHICYPNPWNWCYEFERVKR